MLKYGGLNWGDDDVEQLCLWLRQCRQLRTLSLVGNRIGDKGVQALAAVIGTNIVENLTELNLGSNPIGDDGVRALIRVIDDGHLPNLENMQIRQTDASSAVVAELRQRLTCAPRPQPDAMLAEARRRARERKAKK